LAELSWEAGTANNKGLFGWCNHNFIPLASHGKSGSPIRTSIIFGSIYGFVIFKEKGIKERLTGSIIIVIGVFLVCTTKT
jgi:hypothetical protein